MGDVEMTAEAEDGLFLADGPGPRSRCRTPPARWTATATPAATACGLAPRSPGDPDLLTQITAWLTTRLHAPVKGTTA